MREIFVYLTYNQSLVYSKQKLVPRRFGLDRIHCNLIMNVCWSLVWIPFLPQNRISWDNLYELPSYPYIDFNGTNLFTLKDFTGIALYELPSYHNTDFIEITLFEIPSYPNTDFSGIALFELPSYPNIH